MLENFDKDLCYQYLFEHDWNFLFDSKQNHVHDASSDGILLKQIERSYKKHMWIKKWLVLASHHH